MEQSLGLWLLLLASTRCGEALLDLTGVQEIEGTWRASVTLPCVYEPSAGFKQEAMSWKTSLLDHGIRTIFRRDPTSGDQTLLTHFKNRIHVPKDPPGDVSLLIEDLEMGDRGQYTCEVVWVARNKSKMTKERTTSLRVIKVAVTKPFITAGSVGSILSKGRNANLTCQTTGSPPITYRWFKAAQRGNADQVGQSAVLHLDSLQISDTGTYFCEVENRVGSTVQRSKDFQLTVKDPSEFPTLRPSSEKADNTTTKRDLVPSSPGPQSVDELPEDQAVNPAPQRTSLPLYIIILIAVLCSMALLTFVVVIFCRRKPSPERIYEVTYNNVVPVRREEASSALARTCWCGSEQATPRVENNYTMEPTKMDEKLEDEYEILMHKMESEYEVVDTQ